MSELRRSGAHMAAGITLLVTLVTCTLLGCGARKEYAAERVEVERSSWDSLHVDVAFVERAVIGGASPIRADSVLVTVFDADYDTLYSGGPGVAPVPDATLGDRERLMVEVCGVVRRRQICVQESHRASPKRVHVTENITYPSRGDFEEGSYELDFQVERQRFDGGDWELVDSRPVSGYLLAWVDDPEAKERGAVRIPFRQSTGRFNLARQPNYKNFKYYLDSQLLDHTEADVYFDVYAGLGENKVHLASTKKEVHRKTEDEREQEVRYFAEQATEMIIDELGSLPGGSRAYAYVDGWSFNSIARTYEIELEIEWDGPAFDRGHYEIEGTLGIGEDGSNARFRIRAGNRRAVRKWRARTDGEVLMLGGLEVYRERHAATREASG